MNESDLARFWEKVAIADDAACWLWLASKDAEGYGQFMAQRKRHRAHRFAYAASVGPIGPGLLVCHSCDNPSCVNPNHLFCADQKTNVQDAKRKGRSAVGERHGRAKVTVPEVKEIRRLRSCGWKLREIGAIYGLSESGVGKMCKGKYWKADVISRA